MRIELGTIDRALQIAEQLAVELVHKEAAERIEASKEEWTAAMREVSLCLIGLERALQARDELRKKIRPGPVPLPGIAWPLAGRLSNTASESYRFLQRAVVDGWITEKEFKQEFRNAREVNPT